MDSSGKPQAVSWHWPLLAFLAAGLLLIGFDLADGTAYLGDVDDQMRALQIRDLVSDGEWFDRRLPFITMPGDYVSPWSRLVDLPYYLTVLALAPMLGGETAFAVASSVWPPLLFVLFGVLALRVMRRIDAQGPRTHHAAIAAVLMIFAIWNFVPGRIDHHNVQLVLVMAMLAGLTDPRAGRGGAGAGLAATLSLAVGLECLPFIAVAFGGLALAAAVEAGDARLRLQATGASFALSAIPAALALAGPPVFSDPACDALSGFWVAAMVLFGAVAALVPFAWRAGLFRGRPGLAWRLVSLAVPSAAAALLLVMAYPVCLDGPYHMIDPVSRAFWLDRVQQEGSIALLLEAGVAAPAALLGIYALLAGLALPAVCRLLRAGRYEIAIVWAVAASAAAMALLQIRFLTFPAAIVPLFLPLLLRGGTGEGARRLVLPALVAPPLLVAAWMALSPPSGTTLDVYDLMEGDRCSGADTSVLARTPAGRIMAPLGAAFAVAGNPRGHRVAAMPFHRASPGIRRVALAFAGSTPAERRDALESFDYIVVCRRQTDIDLSPAPLFEALQEGETVPGIVPVEPGNPSAFRLFRLDASVPYAFSLSGDAAQ